MASLTTARTAISTAKYTVKSGDWGTGVFPALPAVSGNDTSDVTVTVTKRFKVGAPVIVDRSPGSADPEGIIFDGADCIAPASVGDPPQVRLRFSNVTSGSLTPTTQQYDFYQF